MAATVKIAGQEATCSDLKWESENPHLQAALTSFLHRDGPSGADPNPDLTVAREAVKRLGGEVVRFDKAKRVEGRIY